MTRKHDFSHDKLGRPLPDNMVGDLPLASDLLDAGSMHRIMAACIDCIIIATLTCATAWLFRLHIVSDIVIACGLSWYGYYVVTTLSPLQATFGQRIAGLYIYRLFGGRLNLILVSARFTLFASALLVFCLWQAEELQLFWLDITGTSKVVLDESFYSRLLGYGLIQTLLIWPFLSGNSHYIIWDHLLRCRVMRYRV